MSAAKNGDKVKVHYTGTLDDGTKFDSSEGREPLEFELGAQQVIPGFEKAVIGMKVGDKVNVAILSEDAYGPHREELMIQVERSEIPEHIPVHEGAQLELRNQDDQALVVTIVDANEEHVVMDGNHPLAGQNLNFDLELVEIG